MNYVSKLLPLTPEEKERIKLAEEEIEHIMDTTSGRPNVCEAGHAVEWASEHIGFCACISGDHFLYWESGYENPQIFLVPLYNPSHDMFTAWIRDRAELVRIIHFIPKRYRKMLRN